MQKIKKVWLLAVSVFLLTIGMGIVSFAANGILQFSDPETKVGEEVTVKMKITAGGAAIGDGSVTVTYDPTYLEFKNGENVKSGANGTIELFAAGTGQETELDYTMVFKALKEGDATLQVSQYKAYLFSDETLNLTTGTSAIKIAAGDGNTETPETTESTASSGDGQKVTVNGTEYTINENFSEAVIPSGFQKTEVAIEGSPRKAMQQESSGWYLFYLTDADGNSDYFLYDEKSAEFLYTELIDISDTTFILIKDYNGSAKLPTAYQKTTSTINGKEFTAWQNTSEVDYFLIYALDSDGNEGFYQYDTTQGTYQRFTVQQEEKAKTATGLKQKLESFINNNLLIILAVIAGILLIMLILIIILSVKLRHRKEELEDVYGPEKPAKKNKKRKKNKYDDEYDDFYDDEYGDEAYADPEFDDYDDAYDDPEYDEDGYDDSEYDDSDYDEDDYDDPEYEENAYDDSEYDDEYDDSEYDDDYDDSDYDEEDYDDSDYDDSDYDEDDYDEDYDPEFDDYEEDYDEDEERTSSLDDKTRLIDLPSRGGKKDDDFSLDFIDLDD